MHRLLLQVGHTPILALPARPLLLVNHVQKAGCRLLIEGWSSSKSQISKVHEAILILNFYFSLARDNLKMDLT